MAAIAAILDFVRQFKRECLSQWRPNVQGRLVSTRRRSLSIFSPVAHPKWPPRQTSWISFLVISNKFKHDLLQNITFLTPVNPSFYGLFYLATHWDQVNLKICDLLPFSAPANPRSRFYMTVSDQNWTIFVETWNPGRPLNTSTFGWSTWPLTYFQGGLWTK